MRYRVLGRMGWQVAEIGFGAWAIGGASWGPQRDEDSIAALHRALDLGVNFIDTAQGYGNGHSERLIGRVLQERGQRRGGGAVRVATKIPPQPGHWPPFPHEKCAVRFSEAYLRERVEFSLRNLNAEVLDLVQLHTWTRAWNRDPEALATLRRLVEEGKLLAIGISTPEHDQNCVIDLMRAGWLDAVQVIYNIFEQEPAAELLPTAQEHQVGVIVRVVLEEGALTGKFTLHTTFAEGDFRRNYFRGERLAAVVRRVEAVRETVARVCVGPEVDLVSVALRFVLHHPAVSTVIPGIRNVTQAEQNIAVADEPRLPDELIHALREHNWQRGIWYGA